MVSDLTPKNLGGWSVNAPRIKVELAGTGVAVEIPLPLGPTEELVTTLGPHERETATVWVEDVLSEGPSSALCS